MNLLKVCQISTVVILGMIISANCVIAMNRPFVPPPPPPVRMSQPHHPPGAHHPQHNEDTGYSTFYWSEESDITEAVIGTLCCPPCTCAILTDNILNTITCGCFGKRSFDNIINGWVHLAYWVSFAPLRNYLRTKTQIDNEATPILRRTAISNPLMDDDDPA